MCVDVHIHTCVRMCVKKSHPQVHIYSYIVELIIVMRVKYTDFFFHSYILYTYNIILPSLIPRASLFHSTRYTASLAHGGDVIHPCSAVEKGGSGYKIKLNSYYIYIYIQVTSVAQNIIPRQLWLVSYANKYSNYCGSSLPNILY